jgi:hypothetical protein
MSVSVRERFRSLLLAAAVFIPLFSAAQVRAEVDFGRDILPILSVAIPPFLVRQSHPVLVHSNRPVLGVSL